MPTKAELEYLASLGIGEAAPKDSERAPTEDTPFSERLLAAAKKLGSETMERMADIKIGGLRPVLSKKGQQRVMDNPWGELERGGKVMDYPGGILRTAVSDAAGRVGGKGPIDRRDYERAILANPKSGKQLVQERWDVSPDWANSVGFALEVGADPTNIAAETFGAGKGMIAEALQGTGKAAYRQPWKGADSRVAEKFRDKIGKSAGPNEVSDLLWNDGEPLISPFTSLPGIKNQYKDLMQQVFKKYSSVFGLDNTKLDIAPGIAKAGDDAANAAQNEAFEKATKEAVTPAAVDPMTGGVTPSSIDPDKITAAQAIRTGSDPAVQAIRNGAIAKAQRELRQEILGGLNGLPQERAKAVEKLKSLVDARFHGLIDDNLAKYAVGEQDTANQFFQTFLREGIEGPRSMQQMDDLARSYSRSAAGSEPLKSNAYMEGAKTSESTINDMATRSKLNDVLTEMIEDAVGPQGAAAFKGEKKKYGIMARGLPEVITMLDKAAKAPLLSQGDAVTAAISPSAFALKKAAGLVFGNNPRFAMGLGVGLNKMSKTNIWDMMAARGLINSGREE